MKKIPMLAGVLMVLGVAHIGCSQDTHADHDHAAMTGAKAVATVAPSQAAKDSAEIPDVTGTVTFTLAADGKMHVVLDLKGLPANSEHGFHIHEKGDLSDPKLVSAGPHFNPGGHKHGGPSATSHAGDLGNIKTDANGNVKADIVATGISFDGANSVVGRSVIIHAKADDLTTDPAGNAGDRIAGGVIEKK